ncbi:type IV pilus modification protein PilV [Neisseria montereyensis]|uniref:Type IV pilus modification protein PilV n=1 Tax=Neisseria montereyensis TaxID=2973938 RepID=A0ABT2FBV7_9NEIS|nr:type IV pilus modification protein PilV [Neisseria montereyensis]MCS4533446.1 type IV pilus modification protein PilV [Neisseria montereyensis]
MCNYKIIHNSRGGLKIKQSGMTLLEVLVAMFVLAVGVLALLATQLRTVSSVREAESQTIVAQAVQNLTEGMMINPTLCSKDDKDRKECAGIVNDDTPEGWVIKSYDNNNIIVDKAVSYFFSNPTKVGNGGIKNWSRSDSDGTILNKRDILEDQLGRFENTLLAALPNTDIYYIICVDNTGNDMTTTNGNCSGTRGKDPMVIKVIWETDVEKAEENTSSLQTNQQNNKKITYTYQAQLTE